jgi:hypothetical protein
VSLRRYVGLVSGALLLVGGAVLCWGVYFGATLPEPRPGSDGVPAGFAIIYVLLVQSGGALLVHLGYALPAGTGRFRVGPLAGRSVVVRTAAATVAFGTVLGVTTVLTMALPDSLPRVVSGTVAFSWLGAAVALVVGVALTLVCGLATAVVRVVRGEPLVDRD